MGDTGTGDMLRGTVSVEFETKEGSARFDKDLKFCKGLLASGANNFQREIRSNYKALSFGKENQ